MRDETLECLKCWIFVVVREYLVNSLAHGIFGQVGRLPQTWVISPTRRSWNVLILHNETLSNAPSS